MALPAGASSAWPSRDSGKAPGFSSRTARQDGASENRGQGVYVEQGDGPRGSRYFAGSSLILKFRNCTRAEAPSYLPSLKVPWCWSPIGPRVGMPGSWAFSITVLPLKSEVKPAGSEAASTDELAIVRKRNAAR